MEKEPIFIFDNSSQDSILRALNLKTNERLQLVDENNNILTSQDFEPITYKEFGGILQGSKTPIKKKSSELVRYFVNKKV